MFKGLSPKRKVLRIFGITIIIVAIILMVIWIPQPSDDYHHMIGDQTYSGSSRFVQVAMIFSGIVMIYVGYRSIKYIPKEEREKYELF